MIAISGALGVGGTAAGIGIAGAGSAAVNAIAGAVTATVDGATTLTPGGAVEVTATDDASIRAIAGAAAIAIGASAGVGVGLAVGISIAINRIGGVEIDGDTHDHLVRAKLSNSTVASSTTRATSVLVEATSTPSIETYVLAGAVGVGASGGVAGSLAGAGAGALNTVLSKTEALVEDSTVWVGSGGLTVEATDESSILADAGSAAVAISGSGGGALAGSIGGAIAFNEIAVQVKASIDPSTIHSTGAVEVTATAHSTIDTIAVAVAGSISGSGGLSISLAGAGSAAVNFVADTVEASIIDSTIDTGAAVTVKAQDTSEITATTGAVAISVGASGAAAGAGAFGASMSINQIGNTQINGETRQHTVIAKVENSTIGTQASPAGVVTVEASSTATIKALAVAGSLAGAVGATGGGIAVAGAASLTMNSIDSTTEALVSDGSSIDAASVEVKATYGGSIDAFALTGSVAIGAGTTRRRWRRRSRDRDQCDRREHDRRRRRRHGHPLGRRDHRPGHVHDGDQGRHDRLRGRGLRRDRRPLARRVPARSRSTTSAARSRPASPTPRPSRVVPGSRSRPRTRRTSTRSPSPLRSRSRSPVPVRPPPSGSRSR